MSLERTEYQSDEQRRHARDLSLKPSRPPAAIPGFSIQQFLGSGTYGEVWSGTDKKRAGAFAIKFYTRRTSEDVRQLAGEVEKLVVLAANRYVVQLIDVGWSADPPYFVMDYIEHGSLEDVLREQSTLPTAEAVELFQEIATGIMHLHGKGILHCDLKPGNVLLDQDGKPRLADFGQSRLKTDQSPSLGTLFYMAPEQADLDAVPDARWDVYSLGALLYSMLCGSPPFYGEVQLESNSNSSLPDRLTQYQSAINRAPKPTAHRKLPGVDRLLADIIDRTIDIDPRKRFGSVQSVLLALRQRELLRARRPLLVLGLLGPLLLLGVVALFATSAYQRAVGDTEVAITKKVEERNEFAAKLAARSATEQIDDYFRAVRQLAREPGFIEDFRIAMNDYELAQIRQRLTNPNDNAESSLEDARQDIARNELLRRLQDRMQVRMDDPYDEYPKAASWFVCDRAGTQVASVFDSISNANTIGRNYSYRTYFSGFDKDLKTRNELDTEIYDVPIEPLERTIIQKPHLSAVFSSRAIFTWKVAFSVPVSIDGEIQGIVAVTVEMGNFVDFENDNSQYAALIDDRPGYATRGIVLEHPVFDQYITNKTQVPLVTVDLETVRKNERFEDPVGELKFGKLYQREWIASVLPVTATEFSAKPGKPAAEKPDQNVTQNELKKNRTTPTGLYVLAAEDYQSSIDSVRELSRRLVRLAILASVFFLIVAIAMWLLVLRMLRESRLKLAGGFSPSSESSISQESKTIPARAENTTS